MKKLLNYFTGIFIIFIALVGMVYFMLSDSVPAKTGFSNYKPGKGGIVHNYTTKKIKISSDSYIGYIPERKNSIDAGIKDVDAIVIDAPMIFHGKIIENKVLKFCNLGTIDLIEDEKGNITINETRLTWVCKLANDFKIYNSVREAFGQR